MDHSSARGHGCRILQYTHRGLTFLALENQLLRVSVLADKGADITEFLHKPTDTDFLWRAPGGVRAPGSLVPTSANPLGGNLDYYGGGWHECIPGGGPAVVQGAPEGLHGEAALMPWSFSVDEDSPQAVSVTLCCRLIRVPFRLRKRLRLAAGQPRLEITEELANEGGADVSFLWGHHPTFGAPFLDEHCRLDIPARRYRASADFTPPGLTAAAGSEGAWPMARDPQGGTFDLSRPAPAGSGRAGLVCMDVDEGWYAVTNTRTRVGFGLTWDRGLFPFLYYWHVYNGVPDYPWFNEVYVAGLEPWTSFPMSHAAALEAGTARRIRAGETIRTSITAVAYSGRERVSRITPEEVS
jgi:hypothetical protein